MSDFTELIKRVIDEYGEDIFRSSQRTNAILMDLAPDQVRNRLLARHFVEAGGFTMLKSDSASIIRRLREDFSLEANAASWIVYVFSEAMGLNHHEAPTAAIAQSGHASLDSGHALGRAVYLTPSFRNEGEIAIGMRHTVGVLRDGTVVAHGHNDFMQCDVDNWRDVVAVAAGDAHTIGLLADGTVLAVGRNNFDQCDVSDFTDIAAVYAFGDDTICIKNDGTVVARGKSHLDLAHFEQISAISWHPEGIYGVRHDGRVMMSSPGWEEEDWVLSLTDTVQIISTYVDGSFALTAEGRVYKMNEPESYFANLRDIAAMVDLSGGFAVLREDGRVRILPYDRTTPRVPSSADDWKGITAIFGKYKRLIGLTADGHLLAECIDPDWLRRNSGRSGLDALDFLNDWYPVGAPVVI